MRMSLSFKKKELFLYDYVQEQLDSAYYIKSLIHNDMKNKNINPVNPDVKKIVEMKNEDENNFQIVFED